jgi:hypothetical protein
MRFQSQSWGARQGPAHRAHPHPLAASDTSSFPITSQTVRVVSPSMGRCLLALHDPWLGQVNESRTPRKALRTITCVCSVWARASDGHMHKHTLEPQTTNPPPTTLEHIEIAPHYQGRLLLDAAAMWLCCVGHGCAGVSERRWEFQLGRMALGSFARCCN